MVKSREERKVYEAEPQRRQLVTLEIQFHPE
jgi:hypothetical protein